MSPLTAPQHRRVRAVLGLYVAGLLATALPWAREIFGAGGPAWVSLGALAGFALALGRWPRCSALLAWLVLVGLFVRQPLIQNPALPFVGWLLLWHAALPRRAGDATAVPVPFVAALWVVASLAYTYSGWHKLGSPSWVDGSALARVLDNPLARESLVRTALLGAPAALLRLATTGGLLLELLYAPLALFPRLRPMLWGGAVVMHAALLVLVDFASLSLGMLVVHAFMWDPAWWPGRRVAPGRCSGSQPA